MARAVEAPGGMRSSQELRRSLLFAICLPITKMVLSSVGRTAQRALTNRFLRGGSLLAFRSEDQPTCPVRLGPHYDRGLRK
jgi:hypothetical protein